MENGTGAARALNILVVEDKPAEQEKVLESAKQAGCACVVASTVEEAVEALLKGYEDSTPFDGAIIDMHLPAAEGETLGGMASMNNMVCAEIALPRVVYSSCVTRPGRWSSDMPFGLVEGKGWLAAFDDLKSRIARQA